MLSLTFLNSNICAVGSMCNTGGFDTPRNIPPYCQPYVMGFLCVLGSGVRYATASRDAEHQGMDSLLFFVFLI